MTKKKNSRQKHQKNASFETTSDEDLSPKPAGKSCQHVTRAIYFGRVKKALKTTQSILSCSGCCTEDSGKELPEVWLCLQCGYRGCGRSSENKHALQHYKTVHSDCHSLVISTSSGIVWCYDCDDAVSLKLSNALKLCAEFVMKSSAIASGKENFSNENAIPSHPAVKDSLIEEETSVVKTEESETHDKNMKSVKNVKDSPHKVLIRGLRNLGNTCFFNAVMQNLNQTPLFIHELTNTCNLSHLWEVPELDVDNEVITVNETNNLKLSLPRLMPLTKSLLNFFNQMNAKVSSKWDIYNPSELFNEISKKCPQFHRFQEQDSHELLRQLLDNVRQEEIKRQKRALLSHFLTDINPEDVDTETKERIRAYNCYASHTIVEKVFGGLLISTVVCEECKVSSQIFEPFMDLSLPLFEEKPLRNRKSDVDDDSHADIVLPKPKNDHGKPSKHQEKKQKQLAKKERKRNRSKNQKVSLSKFEDETSVQPSTSAVDDEKKNANQGSADVENAENDQSEEKLSETDSVKVNFESSTEEKSVFDLKNDDVEECDFPTFSDQNLENSYISENSGERADVIVNGENDLISGDLCTEKNVEDVVNAASDCKNDDLEVENQGIDKIHVPSLTKDIDIEISEKHNDHSQPNVYENHIHVSEQDSLIVNLSKPLNSCLITTDSNQSNSDQNNIITNLSESLSSCLIATDSNQSNLDDRIQALSMQVKDVRIRRDVARQEMLLDSSESADENESQRTHITSSKSSLEGSCSNENCDNWSHSVSEQQTKEWILKSLTTLKPRHNASAMECSITSCLSHFTKPELLTGNNKFKCENCTEMKQKRSGNKKDVAYSNASKQILIFSPPAVLTLHLKRFQQISMSLRKVNRFVEFPLILDLAPFCSSACVVLPHMSSVEDEILYSLYGIVEHSGRLSSGHYTAYVKVNKKSVNNVYECLVPLGQCSLEQLLRRFSGVNKSSQLNSCDQSKDGKAQWFYISDNHVKEVSEAQVLKCQAYLLFYERIK